MSASIKTASVFPADDSPSILGKVRDKQTLSFCGLCGLLAPRFASLFPELVNIAGNKENQDEKREHIGKITAQKARKY